MGEFLLARGFSGADSTTDSLGGRFGTVRFCPTIRRRPLPPISGPSRSQSDPSGPLRYHERLRPPKHTPQTYLHYLPTRKWMSAGLSRIGWIRQSDVEQVNELVGSSGNVVDRVLDLGLLLRACRRISAAIAPQLRVMSTFEALAMA